MVRDISVQRINPPKQLVELSSRLSNMKIEFYGESMFGFLQRTFQWFIEKQQSTWWALVKWLTWKRKCRLPWNINERGVLPIINGFGNIIFVRPWFQSNHCPTSDQFIAIFFVFSTPKYKLNDQTILIVLHRYMAIQWLEKNQRWFLRSIVKKKSIYFTEINPKETIGRKFASMPFTKPRLAIESFIQIIE